MLLTNCIIYGNTSSRVGDDDNLYGTGVTNACWYSDSPGLVNVANHNITGDPLFVGGGDYSLQATTPCLDKGSTAVPYTTDILGNPHLDNDNDGTAQPEMGCYELTALPPPSGTVINIY